MYGLTKHARSWQAKQRRQYERMLKSMYGDTEGYMEHLRESGQRAWPEIHHGTNSENAATILQDGMKLEKFRTGMFGRGLYFGDPTTAESFRKSQRGFRYRLPDGQVRKISSRDDTALNHFLDNHHSPHGFRMSWYEDNTPGLVDSAPATIRFKTPNEIKGTRWSYPNAQHVKVVDLQEGIPSLLAHKGSRSIHHLLGTDRILDLEAKTPETKRSAYGMLGDRYFFKYHDHENTSQPFRHNNRQFFVQQDIPGHLLTNTGNTGPHTKLLQPPVTFYPKEVKV